MDWVGVAGVESACNLYVEWQFIQVNYIKMVFI